MSRRSDKALSARSIDAIHAVVEQRALSAAGQAVADLAAQQRLRDQARRDHEDALIAWEAIVTSSGKLDFTLGLSWATEFAARGVRLKHSETDVEDAERMSDETRVRWRQAASSKERSQRDLYRAVKAVRSERDEARLAEQADLACLRSLT